VTIGGTSLSSPLTSALYALAGGSGGVSYPAATLYGHLGQAPSLYDVTEGGNGYCDGEAAGPCGEPKINEKYGDIDCLGTTACDAAPCFDGPSGVGTPKGLGAFKSNATFLTTQTTATLNAKVNPDGKTVTECEFEYGTSTKYARSRLVEVVRMDTHLLGHRGNRDAGIGWWGGGDAGSGPDALHACLGERQSAGGQASLTGEDIGDLTVGVVLSEAADRELAHIDLMVKRTGQA
jgi:hypothetical protein